MTFKSDPKIVVLTPIKNEEWILDQFLTITSLFADHIIIADQNSTDASRAICTKFPKVKLIENKESEFNESGRQTLLIETSRSLFPNSKRILFALDADELLFANNLHLDNVWEEIKSSSPGTTIYIEKPDILLGIKKCVRYRANYFPIGYVDDGTAHSPKIIHSKRIPENPGGRNLFIDDIKVLHFAHSRRNVQSAKLRYYSVIENIKRTTPLYLRRSLYKCNYDEQSFYSGIMTEDMPEEWLNCWNKNKIDLRNFDDPELSWHDFEVLRLFKKYGYRKFHFENIWCFDWEGCRQIGIISDKEVPSEKIIEPGPMQKAIAKGIDLCYRFYRQVKKK